MLFQSAVVAVGVAVQKCVYIYIYIYKCIYVVNKNYTSIIILAMIQTLNGPIKELLGLGRLEYHYNGIIIWAIIWDPNKVSDIGEWSICGGGRLERFYWIYIKPLAIRRVAL